MMRKYKTKVKTKTTPSTSSIVSNSLERLPLRKLLAGCYTKEGQQEETQALSMNDMQAALAMLSDDDPDNDDQEDYTRMAHILIHTGD